MSESKERVAAVESLVTLDPEQPKLLGTVCGDCGSYFFPAERVRCRNPSCGGSKLESVELSAEGTVWSYTNSCYKPPLPYVAEDPFVPYTLAAVQLEKEKMVVLGQMVKGTTVDDMSIGMKVALRLEVLNEGDEKAYMVWKWAAAEG